MEAHSTKTKLVMIGNHTLGYIAPNSSLITVMAASILKGSPYDQYDQIRLSAMDNLRLAGETDFHNMDCVFAGFAKDPDYIHIHNAETE